MISKMKLKDVGIIVTGNTPSKKNKDYYDSNDINFFTPTDFEDGRINDFEESVNYISNNAKEKARILPEGSVLVTCIGIIGKVGIVEKESAFNQQINAIIPNKDIIDNRYLAYWLISKADYLRKKANAPVVPIINKTDFQELEIIVPDMKYQKEIVNRLDKVQTLIDINQEQSELLENLIKSHFVKTFGNPVINDKNLEKQKLSDLGSFKNGINFNKDEKGYSIKFLGVGEFKYGNIIKNSEFLQNVNLSAKPSDDYLLRNNDIVFVRSNGSKELVGRSVLIKNINENVIYSGFCIRYRNENSKINVNYLINLFQNEDFKDSFKKDSRGANINNINQQILSELDILIPPIELQTRFEEFTNKIDKQKEKLQNRYENLETLKNGMMNKYFN